jgi:hypothetical protein
MGSIYLDQRYSSLFPMLSSLNMTMWIAISSSGRG